MDVEDELHAAHGVGLAHTALIVATLGALREKGVFTRLEVSAIFDSAITGAEESGGAPAEARDQARRLLEIIANEMCGRRE